MRQLQLVVALAVAACGKAEAETVRASFGVSVTVVDQCIVRATVRSATCTGGTVYAVGVARERVSLVTRDQSTDIGEYARIYSVGPPVETASPARGMSASGGQEISAAALADGRATAGLDRIDALRITYSF